MQIHSSNIGMVQITELKFPLNNQASTLLIVRHLEHTEALSLQKYYLFFIILFNYYFYKYYTINFYKYYLILFYNY